ncbi:HLA class II histocompatibility antigen, DP beta 1 chain-like [Salminus brasiliensis]|uniref:HLA class II histocompatibility antigen, DP beta 1 chain-like n=1 Tax=Salminus brasiliensis TaxID=930266 RepID=UPI003B836E3A
MFLSLQLLLLLAVLLGTDGYYYSMIKECISSSSDMVGAEYIDSYYFNKQRYVQFNSTVGKFVGFTEFGVKTAEIWNARSDLLAVEIAELDRVCKPNLEIQFSHILGKTVEPKIRLRSEQQASGDHPAMLMCSAYDFYPPAIDVYWLRDGQKVTTETISIEEMADGDWYYQMHSHLEYTPKSGEKISCVVEHASSKKPIITDWDPSLPQSEKNKVAIGASGLVLGIVLSAAGFIYYKKKTTV